MSRVFVLDSDRRPLMPCTSARARLLLHRKRAVVLRRFPFTIILKAAKLDAQVQPLRLKLDPGSRSSGLAIVNDASGEVIFAAEIVHRGERVRKALAKRRAVRRSRRQRKTRYRPSRFENRRCKQGWLAPSLNSRLANLLTWVARLGRWCPIGHLSQELVKFDTALLQEPELSGVEYQHGTLFGFEVRQYLLTKWGWMCAYCGAKGVRLEVDHIRARSLGGSDRVSNLTVACHECNLRKGNRPVEEFLTNSPLVLKHVLAHAKAPLKDAAAVNATRWALHERLQTFGLPIELGTGGRTKWNREIRGLPKMHWLDAANVGASTPDVLHVDGVVLLIIMAVGRGSRQMCRMDRFGFPRTRAKTSRTIQDFRSGDLVEAVVTQGKRVGTYRGRVAVRATGSFDITTSHGTVQGISHRSCILVQRNDGYRYERKSAYSSIESRSVMADL